MKYQILFCSNLERDLKYLSVLTSTIVDHFRAPHELHFHVCWFGEECESIGHLSEHLEHLPGAWSFHRIHEFLGEEIDKPGFGFWAYLWALENLSLDAERLLYMDADMLVQKDLSECWDLDLGGCPVGMVCDPGGREFGFGRKLAREAGHYGLSYSEDELYFNAGFQVIDLPLWREQGIVDKVLRHFREQYHRPFTGDQDGLNILLAGKIKSLSPRFNLLECLHFYEHWDYEIYREFEEPEEYFEAVVRHFAGSSKVESPYVRAPMRELYYGYLKSTPWWPEERAQATSLWRKTLAQLLEFHYLLVRGVKQGGLRSPWSRLFKLLVKTPYLPLLYPAIPLYRLYRKLREGFS